MAMLVFFDRHVPCRSHIVEVFNSGEVYAKSGTLGSSLSLIIQVESSRTSGKLLTMRRDSFPSSLSPNLWVFRMIRSYAASGCFDDSMQC